MAEEARERLWTREIGAFLERCRGRGSAVRSVDFYRRWIEAFAAWCGGQGVGELSDVTPSLVAAWRDHCLTDLRHSAATVRVRQELVTAFLRFCTEEGYTREFPSGIRVAKPKRERPAPKWLSDRDADRLLRVAQASGARDAALISLLLLAGLRVGEAVGMWIGDVQLRLDAASWVTVHTGKGMKTRRVPLPRRGRDALTRWIKESRPQGDGFLFPGRDGKGHLTARAAALLVERLRIQAGVAEPVSPHQLRHTFAHRLVSRGIPLERVAELLGHSGLNTTRIYVAPTPEELAADVARAWE